MIDFSKHKKGSIVTVHCCDNCVRRQGVEPVRPPESGGHSLMCENCGHFGIGSTMECEIGDWLKLKILRPAGT